MKRSKRPVFMRSDFKDTFDYDQVGREKRSCAGYFEFFVRYAKLDFAG